MAKVALTLALLATAACSSKKDKTPAPTPTPTPTPTVPLPASPTADSSVLLVLTVNSGNDVAHGQPIVLTLALHQRDPYAADAKPITLAGRTTWSDAVTLTVKDSTGRQQSWPMQSLVAKPKPTLTIDGTTSGELLWRLPAADVAKLPVGAYTITAALDTTTTTVAGAWHGTTSASVPIRLVATATDPHETSLLLAYEASLTGDGAVANAKLDEILKAKPDHVGALTAKGDLLAEAGNVIEARKHYDAAIDAVFATKADGIIHASDLIRRRNALLDN